MKAYFLTFILLITLYPVLCQKQAWQTNLKCRDDLLIMDMKENENREVFLSANAFKLNGTKNYALIYKLDKEGHILDALVIEDSVKAIYISSVHFIEDDNISLFGALSDSVTGLNVSFFNKVYNTNFEELSSKTHIISPDTRIYDFATKVQPNTNILLFGSCSINPARFTSMVYEFDSTFTLVKWNLPDSNNFGHYVDMQQLNDSIIWALKVFPWLYEKLDSSFNVIEYYQIPRSMLGNSSCKWANDSTFYLFSGNLPGYNLAVIKQFHPFDTTGHLFWRWRQTDTIDFPSVWKGIDFKHPDTLFAGGTSNLSLSNPYYAHQPSWLVVFQTDSMLNLRWERFYGGDAYYVMMNLMATNDGGCLLGGARFDYHNATANQRDIILLKLNSEGLLTGIDKMPEFQVREAIVYPNPGNEMNIRLAAQHPQALLRLLDQHGRIVLQQHLIGTESLVNTSYLANGIYMYQLTAPTGLSESGKWMKQ